MGMLTDHAGLQKGDMMEDVPSRLLAAQLRPCRLAAHHDATFRHEGVLVAEQQHGRDCLQCSKQIYICLPQAKNGRKQEVDARDVGGSRGSRRWRIWRIQESRQNCNN